MGLATPGLATSPIDILLACVAEVGIEGQIATESGTEQGREFARVIRNRSINRREAKRINTCADGSGGFSGLFLAQPRFASAASSYATVDAYKPHPLCVPGGGVMQRGGLYCLGH